MNIQERHLVDRYLQGELSGIELENFKIQLSTDADFKHEVDVLRIIYSGIEMARNEQLENKILRSIKYRKPTIPFALKLIITFFIITVSFISFWFYAGKEFTNTPRQKPWYTFMNKNSLSEKTKKNNEEKAEPKKTTMIVTKKEQADTVPVADQWSESGDEQLNQSENNSVATNTEDIVVKHDQMLTSTSLPVTDMSSSEIQDTADHMAMNASRKMNLSSDLPTPETITKNYEVEFWISPVNYKGYMMSKNKIILFGIEEPDDVKLYRVNDMVYMSYLRGYYELETNYDFKPFKKLKESEIPSAIK